MPMFSTQPSGSLTGSIRDMVASLRGGNINPLAYMQADHMAAQTAEQNALAEKARMEVESQRQSNTLRNDPVYQSQFASRAAGVPFDVGMNLDKSLTGVHERPFVQNDDEGNRMPDITYARPEGVTDAQSNLYNAARQSLMAANLAPGKVTGDGLIKDVGAAFGTSIGRLAQEALAKGDVTGASALSQSAKPGAEIKLWAPGTGTGTVFNPATGDIQANMDVIRAEHPQQLHQFNDPTTNQPMAFNPANGSAAPVTGPDGKPLGNATTSAGASGVTGEEYLATLPKADATQVKAMIDGRLAFPGGMALKTPYWQNKLNQAAQYDPEFDATIWKRRNDAASRFASGKEGAQVRAIDQSLTHAGLLKNAIDKLDNFNGLLTPLNGMTNWVESKTGDSRQGVFEMNARALASELRKVYAGGGGGSLTELQNWESGLPLNASKEQQTAFLSRGMELLQGAMGALDDQYKRAMGPNASVKKLFSPSALKAMEVLTGAEPSAEPPAAQVPAASSSRATPAKAATTKEGATGVSKSGRPIILKGGSWVYADGGAT